MLETLREIDWTVWVGAAAVSLVILRFAFVETRHAKFKRQELPTTMDDSAFEQAGVRITYSRRTIRFPDRREFPVTAVRALRFETFKRPNEEKWFVYIEVEDMTKPLYTFRFSHSWVAGAFIPRVRMALEKAGSRAFQTISAEHIEAINPRHFNVRYHKHEPKMKLVHVTHLFTFSNGLSEEPEHRYFLRADPGESSEPSFRLHPGLPLSTSYGEDIYRRYFKDETAEMATV